MLMLSHHSFFNLIPLLFCIFYIYSIWLIFEKAGEAGWKAIIPIYNNYILIKIAGHPWWFLLLLFVPFVNFFIIFIIFLSLSRKFGHDVGFALGLLFLGFIFIPILAFNDDIYNPHANGALDSL
jgi:hypothetical protein